MYALDIILKLLNDEFVEMHNEVRTFDMGYQMANDGFEGAVNRATVVYAEVNLVDLLTGKIVLSYLYNDEGEKRVSWTPETLEIAYGKGYNEKINDFTGTIVGGSKVIETNAYLTPYYTVYALRNGKVAMVVNKVHSDLVRLFPHISAYYKFIDQYKYGYVKPE